MASYDLLKLQIQTNNLSNLCRTWVVVGGGDSRLPNGILGLLCRQHYPGIITLASTREPAYTFDHYYAAEDLEYRNKAMKVKAEFWVCFPLTTLVNTSNLLDFS